MLKISWPHLLLGIILGFFLLFVYRSFNSMVTVPFNEFDEAHRAENARRMKDQNSFLIPVAGSPYDRVTKFRTPFKHDTSKFLYFHLERPPLIYDMMILSTLIFGSNEFAYRFPSFLLGMFSFLVFIFFARYLSGKFNFYGLVVGIICLITSTDLWLSSQYAQLDTGLTTFLFLSLLSLIAYLDKKKEIFLIVSALSFSLGILSKGQPAILLLPVILWLFLTKKIGIKSLIKFIGISSLAVIPWIIYASLKFGSLPFLQIFSGFVFITAAEDIVHHNAPIFWYARWWWDTLRPGWTLFLGLVLTDIFHKRLSLQKQILLVFIIFDFLFLSAFQDKLWWYVLPLVPAICFYIYLSTVDYLKDRSHLLALAIAIIILSRPSIHDAPNKVALLYGSFSTMITFFLLNFVSIAKVNDELPKIVRLIYHPRVLFKVAIIFSLTTFYLRFPHIIPYHWNVKPVATYFSQLEGNKCLWIYDIPTESIIFYSNVGEVYTYTKDATPYTYRHCTNYLITTAKFKDLKLEYKKGNIKLYKF